MISVYILMLEIAFYFLILYICKCTLSSFILKQCLNNMQLVCSLEPRDYSILKNFSFWGMHRDIGEVELNHTTSVCLPSESQAAPLLQVRDEEPHTKQAWLKSG